MSNVTRMSTANMYANTIATITQRQREYAEQMEHVSAGKKVIRASDDPVGAAQAERASNRLSRLDTDQRALDAQNAAITYGESTLGEVQDALQKFRELAVNAGNGVFTQTERDALVQQMESLRNQILGYANRKDSNGLPLFRGLDSQDKIIAGKYEFAGQPGQQSSSDYSIASSLDGALAFMNGATGNGVLAVDLGAGNQGKAWADVGTIKDPAAATAFTGPQTIRFGQDADGKPTYSIVDAGGNPVNDANGNPITNLPYKSGQAIRVGGMDLTITGETKPGDEFVVKRSQRTDLFSVLDSAIHTARDSGKMDGKTAFGELAHGLARSLAEIDTAMNRVSTVRGYAGDLMQQAKRMDESLLDRKGQVEALRAGAEDLSDTEQVEAIARLQNQQIALSASLQAYASIQKLSLFDFIR